MAEDGISVNKAASYSTQVLRPNSEKSALVASGYRQEAPALVPVMNDDLKRMALA